MKEKGEIKRIEKLVEEVEKYERATETLVEKMEEIECLLYKTIKNFSKEEIRKLDYNYIGFRYQGSNLGKSLHLVLLREIGRKKVIGRSGKEFYWHGQFGYIGQYMNARELLWVAHRIGEWIENATKVIQAMREETEEAVQSVEKEIEKIQKEEK